MDHYISLQFFINTYIRYLKKIAPDIAVFKVKALSEPIITFRTFRKMSLKLG